MEHNIKPGQLYKHFKGDTMKIIFIAKDSETEEDMVVYDHMGTDARANIWVRPAKMFLETIERDGKQIKRFELIEE